jgi:hypothetical protein
MQFAKNHKNQPTQWQVRMQMRKKPALHAKDFAALRLKTSLTPISLNSTSDNSQKESEQNRLGKKLRIRMCKQISAQRGGALESSLAPTTFVFCWGCS